MTKLYFLFTSIFTVFTFSAFSQNVAINNTGATADSSSILDVQSNSKGVLFPRMTDSQRMAIHLPATGLFVYQTNGATGFYFNSGTPAAPNWILLAKNNILPVVITGNDTTINIPADSIGKIILTGSATDKDGTIKGYLWSQVSGPNWPVVVSPGSASASAIGVISGTYVFQLMATDNSGATAVKPISVTVIQHLVTSLTLQPDQNPDEVLLVVNENGNASDKTAPELSAVSWTYNGGPATTRGIFKFDLSTIPANATILSAKLTLYSDSTPLNGDLVHPNYGSSNSMLIQRVTSGWTNSITWYNQPSTDDSTQIIIPHTSQSFLDLNNIDVTAMVKTMLPNANNGFLIRLQTETPYNSRIFCSSKYADANRHPKLEIQYSK